ncbi:integrase [Paraburkholderia phytofirmans OLGA172]|uniref:Integrase n=1 Tax=Paraburkholderia phytofirmans OLGA172 TaxID=1417228 RepID=A0A160FK60_9BURK|nr:tyrosine-type recombinase/integrase [Paraburkholderia phytofirmans]ANB72614.1 integrase [Paraburkholderia phytofirmans OLGA172]ANB75910.1 integrase [Paraburkholderia phytofirmans OLGA172]
MQKAPSSQTHLGIEPSVLESMVSSLPELPPVVRYYDDFDDTLRSVPEVRQADILGLHINGRLFRLDLSRYPSSYGTLQKHLLVFLLGEDLHISTCFNVLNAAMHLDVHDVERIVEAGPTRISTIWMTLRGRQLVVHAYRFVKAVLRLLCRHRLYGWSESYLAYVSACLPGPATDKYARVRSGDVFLSVDEEAAIVRYLDETSNLIRTSGWSSLPYEALCDAAMVLCSYQFAMRPIQIAMLTMRDVRIWDLEHSGEPTVHLTFLMVKQQGKLRKRPMVRRVKQEWGILFIALVAYADSQGRDANDRVFGVKSNHEAGSRIARRVEILIGDDACAMDLRHTAAQRLVDAGASHEELAEFMGHSHVQTGLVYYATSATHAERVNRALGASDIYRRVAKIAHDRFISPEELTQLKGEQQIAGVPHGIPIAGIGGCKSGQPACPYNPVTSCYGCRKFMPLHDKTMHERVLAEMREVVIFFDQSSRGDTRSPAYLQLQRTIAEIQTVIEELEADNR